MTAHNSPEKPGVKYRRRQLEEAERERREYSREAESATTGNVSTRQAVGRAKANLQRLLNALRKNKSK